MPSLPLSMRARRPLRPLAVAAALGLAAGLLVPAACPVPVATAADGLSLGPVTSLPNQAVPSVPDVLAGTGTRYIIRSRTNEDLYTLDNGTTWRAVPSDFVRKSPEPGDDQTNVDDHVVGYGGTFVGLKSVADGVLRLQRWDPASGAVTTFATDLVDSTGDGLLVDDFVGTTVVLNDGRVFAIAGDQLTELTPKYAAADAPHDSAYALSADGRTVVRQGRASAAWGALSVAQTNRSAVAVTVRVDGLLSIDVSGDQVHYLVGTKASLRVCRAELATPKQAKCVKLSGGDHRYAVNDGNASLTTSAGADQVFFASHTRVADAYWIVQGTKKARVSLRWLPFRDTTKPMAIAYSKAAKLEVASTVALTGKTTPLFAAPADARAPYDVSLTSGRVAYVQTHYSRAEGVTNNAWTRSRTATDVGAETRLTKTAVASPIATGGRTVVQPERTSAKSKYSVQFYDGATRTATYTVATRSPLIAAGGPYALVYRTVVRADGKAMAAAKGWPATVALFGSLVVEADSTRQVAGRKFRVRDLERPATPPAALELPRPAGRVYRSSSSTGLVPWPMFGDWVVAPYEGDAYGQVVINYRTHQVYDVTGPGTITAVGDGWVLHTDYDATPSTTVRVLATGQTLAVPQGAYAGVAVTDGIRTVGWDDYDTAWTSTFRLAEIQGLPVSSARLLGTLGGATFKARGKARWQPKFDLTKAVQAGTLELRNGAGVLVRALPTKATSTGSVRGVSWDGRNSAGKRVAAGTYAWTLKVDASDASGAALSVDGLRPASGTVKVTR
ncbi:MAG TPA: FlgD immunoglobulin-like domain containing protein [Propionicimonas sp.]|nr:FlgD immunoglobulin-like domain containing protein [Propionicimonas sp.]HRA06149.1 FlgD immunoglobulin-like domain containing protein [Propionicimonas sp.]